MLKRIAAAFAALLIVVLVQAPAYAADGYQETDPGIPAAAAQGCDPDALAQIRRTFGQACFFHNGDDFWIVDKAADGHSVAIQWKLTDGSRSGLIRDKLGYQVNSMKGKDFLEDKILKWRMGRCDETPTNDCRQASDYTGWGVESDGTPEAYCTPANGGYGVDYCNWP